MMNIWHDISPKRIRKDRFYAVVKFKKAAKTSTNWTRRPVCSGRGRRLPQHIQDAELLLQWLEERFIDNNAQALKRGWVSPGYPTGSVSPGACSQRCCICIRTGVSRSRISIQLLLLLTAGFRIPAENSGRRTCNVEI